MTCVGSLMFELPEITETGVHVSPAAIELRFHHTKRGESEMMRPLGAAD